MNTIATALMPSAIARSSSARAPSRSSLQLDRAVGAHALVDFDDALEQHLRLDDVLGEDLRPRLIADAQRVAETLGGEQQRAVALALQQRIGRDRGAHLHRADPAGGDWLAFCKTQQVADALHRGVPIGFGIFGEELVRDQRAVGLAPDDVGEGAAAIDPEIPSLEPAPPLSWSRLFAFALRLSSSSARSCLPQQACHSRRRKSGPLNKSSTFC